MHDPGGSLSPGSGPDRGRSEDVDRPEGAQELTRERVAAMYVTEREQLFRLAWLITGDTGAAQDLVQEAFARLWHRPEQVREPDRASAYARSIVLNLARSRATTSSRRAHLDRRWFTLGDEGADPGADLGDREQVRVALARLSPRQRTCVVCRYWLDLSDAEIAEATGMALGTVKTHLRRGLASLRRDLDLDEDRRTGHPSSALSLDPEGLA